MSYLKLSKRATQGRLLEYANYEDGSFINLIELDRPYKDGTRYSVHETTKSPFCSCGIFKDHETARRKFNLMVLNGAFESKLIETGVREGEKFKTVKNEN